jgi:MFS family permease
MLTIFRQRNFALLWLGSTFSSLGNWILIAALPFYIYLRTGSALATGTLFMVEILPTLFFGSLTGAFVDQWDQRWTLILAEWLSAFVLLLLLVIQSGHNLWLVYVVSFLEALLAQCINSASSVLIPNLVLDDQLVAANSATSLGQELTRLLGPTLGGLIFSFFGLTSVILVDSFSFLFCGFCILFITFSPANESISHMQINNPAKTNVLQEWRKGLRLVLQDRLITALFIVTSIAMIGEGFGRVVFIPFIKDVVHGNAIALGWLLTAQGIGGVIGSLFNDRLSKLFPAMLLIALSGIVLGLLNAIVISFPLLPLVLLVYLFGGGPVVFFLVGLYTLLQQNVPASYRGRIFGTYGTTNTILLLLGMLLSSALTIPLGPRLVLGLMGTFYFLAGIVAFSLRRVTSISTTQDWTSSQHDER